MSKHTITIEKTNTIEMLKKKIADSKTSLEVPKITSGSTDERSWVPRYSPFC